MPTTDCRLLIFMNSLLLKDLRSTNTTPSSATVLLPAHAEVVELSLGTLQRSFSEPRKDRDREEWVVHGKGNTTPI